MGLKPEAPKAPDPTKTAASQYQYNKQGAQDTVNMSALNRSGPLGATSFARDASGNVTGQNVSLSSALQPGVDATMGNYSAQTGLLPSGAFTSSVDANGIRDAYINNASRAAQPEWDRQDRQNEVRLAERGIPIGSEAWTDTQNQVGEQRNNYLNTAANNAWIAGTQEEQRQRGNQLQDYLLPYQTAGQSLGLLGGINGLQDYAQTAMPGVQAPNYEGLVDNKYKIDMANYQNQVAGLGDLAKTGLGLLTAPMTGGLSLSLLGAGGAGGGAGMFKPYSGF